MNITTFVYEEAVRYIQSLSEIDGTKESLFTQQQFEPEQMLVPKSIISNPEYVVGEFLWYASGSNKLDFINKYSSFWNKISDDGITCRSAYGHLLKEGHDFDQLKKVAEVLKKDPNSRQAIVQLFKPTNSPTKDTICTLTGQFLIRNNKLHMGINMRSNDINLGQKYDVIMFSFLQQYIAHKLGIETGTYCHQVGSLHMYKRHFDKFQKLNSKDFVLTCEYEDVFRLDSNFWEHDLKILIRVERELRTQQYTFTNGDMLKTIEAKIMLLILEFKWYKSPQPLVVLNDKFGHIKNNGLLNMAKKYYENKLK